MKKKNALAKNDGVLLLKICKWLEGMLLASTPLGALPSRTDRGLVTVVSKAGQELMQAWKKIVKRTVKN